MTQLKTRIADEPTQAQDLPHAPSDSVPRTNVWDAIQYIMGVLSTLPASAVAFTPAGDVEASNVQGAIEELDAEKQPLDADLTAIAALTTTAFGRALLTLVDAAALRTAAALGTIATQNANNVALTGGTITGMPDPTNAADVTTKGWVEALVAAGVKRGTVRVATTGNVTISTALNAGDSIDGVVLVGGDLVLVKSQSAPAENGIYVAGAVPARSAEFDTYNEHPGAFLAVQEGSTLADTFWFCTSNVGGTLNTTAIAFSQFVATGDVIGQSLSVDSEIALFSGTGGKTIKRATTTGLLKGTSGVISAATAGTDYLAPAGTDQGPITGGAQITPLALNGGSAVTTGTLTVDVSDCPMQSYTNGGAHSLAVDTNHTGWCMVLITNNGSAGAITTSAFDDVFGDSFTTTNGHVFECTIVRWSSSQETLYVRAMQ
jgi:hypothetical protein